MSDVLALRQAMETFGSLGEQFACLIQTQPEGWQRSYVALRRILHETISVLGSTGRSILSQRGDAALLRKFEDTHAHYRSLMALHQADWPVVSINPENPDYLRSMDDVSAAYLDFSKAIDYICE